MIRAGADDHEAAQLAGVNRGTCSASRRRSPSAPWASGAWPSACTPSSPPTTGTDTILLFAFAAVVIGGLGSLWGTLLGGVVLGVAQQIGAQINLSYGALAGYVVFLVVLVLRPQG